MSFSNSCTDIGFSGSTLIASCVGEVYPNVHYPTSINTNSYIGNDDGELVWGGILYASTCSNLSLDGTVLNAFCQYDGGEYIIGDGVGYLTSINLDECIANQNGNCSFCPQMLKGN